MDISTYLTAEQALHITAVQVIVQERMPTDPTGHDYAHIMRVTRTAQYIALKEGADIYITTLIALLHDIADHKFHAGNREIGAITAQEILKDIGVPEAIITEICESIPRISYSGAGGKQNIFPISEPDGTMHTTPAACAQDADRLDAIGAVGIARAFAYGGAQHHPLYSETETHNTVEHFDEKLVKIYALLNTRTARTLGEDRHHFLQQFKDRFLKEWHSKDLP